MLRIRNVSIALAVGLALASLFAFSRLERRRDPGRTHVVPVGVAAVVDVAAGGAWEDGAPAPPASAATTAKRAGLVPTDAAPGVVVRDAGAWSLRLRVADGDDAPVAYARCTLHVRDQDRHLVALSDLTTNTKGEALFPRIEAERIALTVVAPGYARSFGTLNALPGDHRELSIVLVPEVPLEVVVTEAWGSPIANARVVAWTGTDVDTIACPTPWEARTDVQGVARLMELGAGANAPALELSVDADLHCEGRRTVRRTSGEEPVRLVLVRTGAIEVRVEDANGQPLAAEVEVAASEPMGDYGWLGWLPSLPQRAATGDPGPEGRARRIEGVPIGVSLDVIARVSGAPVAYTRGVFVPHGRTLDLMLVPPPHVRLEVLVRNDVREDGRVTLDSTDGLQTAPTECVFRRPVPLSYAAAIGDDGEANFDVRPGRYLLSVRDAHDRVVHREDVVVDGPKRLEVLDAPEEAR